MFDKRKVENNAIDYRLPIDSSRANNHDAHYCPPNNCKFLTYCRIVKIVIKMVVSVSSNFSPNFSEVLVFNLFILGASYNKVCLL